MIHVVTTVHLNPEAKKAYLDVLQSVLPEIRREQGCLAYYPTEDIDTDIAIQEIDPDTILLIEEWEELKCLKNHFATLHMERYREAVKDFVSMVEMRVTHRIAFDRNS